MDINAVLQSIVGSGPLAVLLFYWMTQERKERRELQARLLATLSEQAKTSDAIRRVLERGKDG